MSIIEIERDDTGPIRAYLGSPPPATCRCRMCNGTGYRRIATHPEPTDSWSMPAYVPCTRCGGAGEVAYVAYRNRVRGRG